jgi:4-hydroxybenzoate polyprenyltransferase
MAAYSSGLPIGNYCVDLVKCLIGAFIMRSSACTINDIFDRKMDAGVGTFFILFNISYLRKRTQNERVIGL